MGQKFCNRLLILSFKSPRTWPGVKVGEIFSVIRASVVVRLVGASIHVHSHKADRAERSPEGSFYVRGICGVLVSLAQPSEVFASFHGEEPIYGATMRWVAS